MAKYVSKTKVEPLSVPAFIEAIENPQRQAEARVLLETYGKATGYPAKLYTGGMIGFGRYDYIYDSGHSGTSFATGFAARKAELSMYGLRGGEGSEALLAQLGKHRAAVGCVYAKHLDQIDLGVLAKLISGGLDNLRTRYEVLPE